MQDNLEQDNFKELSAELVSRKFTVNTPIDETELFVNQLLDAFQKGMMLGRKILIYEKTDQKYTHHKKTTNLSAMQVQCGNTKYKGYEIFYFILAMDYLRQRGFKTNTILVADDGLYQHVKKGNTGVTYENPLTVENPQDVIKTNMERDPRFQLWLKIFKPIVDFFNRAYGKEFQINILSWWQEYTSPQMCSEAINHHKNLITTGKLNECANSYVTTEVWALATWKTSYFNILNSPVPAALISTSSMNKSLKAMFKILRKDKNYFPLGFDRISCGYTDKEEEAEIDDKADDNDLPSTTYKNVSQQLVNGNGHPKANGHASSSQQNSQRPPSPSSNENGHTHRVTPPDPQKLDTDRATSYGLLMRAVARLQNEQPLTNPDTFKQTTVFVNSLMDCIANLMVGKPLSEREEIANQFVNNSFK